MRRSELHEELISCYLSDKFYLPQRVLLAALVAASARNERHVFYGAMSGSEHATADFATELLSSALYEALAPSLNVAPIEADCRLRHWGFR